MVRILLKQSIWIDVEVSKEKADAFIKYAKANNGVAGFEDIGVIDEECRYLYETVDKLTPADNCGQSTIEVYDDDDMNIYNNDTQRRSEYGIVINEMVVYYKSYAMIQRQSTLDEIGRQISDGMLAGVVSENGSIKEWRVFGVVSEK